MPVFIIFVLIFACLIFSIPLKDECDHWYLSPIAALLLTIWWIVSITQPLTINKKEIKKVTIIEGTAALKIENHLINLNIRTGEQYSENDEVIVKHPNQFYAGIWYPLEPRIESKKDEQKSN